MEASTILQLEARRALWKFEWEALLRREPSVSALGNPDTLVFKMDDTITAVLAQLRKDLAVMERRSSLRLPLERHCDCRMNPLAKFYATGELALRSVAPFLQPRELDVALARFRLIGIDEIECLCSVCQNRMKSGHPAAGSHDWSSRCAAYRG
jgi:hypothetical protein